MRGARLQIRVSSVAQFQIYLASVSPSNTENKLMEPTTLAQSPFAALTFIAAPALLTTASSVRALSTINRMLRTGDRMHELFAKSEGGRQPETDAARLIQQVNRVEKQATLLLRALHSIYLALAAFAAATFVTLLGAVLVPFQGEIWFRVLAGFGGLLGLFGVAGGGEGEAGAKP